MEELLETFLTYFKQEDVDLNIKIKNKIYGRDKRPTITISGKIITNQTEINLTAELIIKKISEKLPSIDERFPATF